MTPTRLLFALALGCALSACKKDGDDGDTAGSAADGGDGGGAMGWNGADPSTEAEYYQAYGYEACRLQTECVPEAAEYYSYEQCVADVDTATAYFDTAFADCTFDAALAEQCWQQLEGMGCEGYTGGDSACADDIWICD